MAAQISRWLGLAVPVPELGALATADQGRGMIVTCTLGVQLRKELAVTETTAAPAVTGVHHFSPTVSDVEASAQWYERVFGLAS